MKLVGQLLGGRYEVRRELARGGMGAVLEAHDRRLDRRVAIKAALSDGAKARLRFVDEAQVTGRLGHPSIVSVFELGAEGERPFLVMKFVQGRTLRDVAREPLEKDALRRRLRLFLRVTEALAFAHERGVIHRDLKPANIMVGEGGEVLVLDWGLARPFEGGQAQEKAVRSAVREALARGDLLGEEGARPGDLTVEGAIMGTAAYMPPEQAEGDPLDARADVYALGATLYELLRGAAPYSGLLHEVLAALLQRRPPPPLGEVAGVPPAVAAIVEKAMAPEREGRYADARAMAADVEAFLDERPVSAWREPAGVAARRALRRHRGALVAAGLGLVAVLAGGLGARQVVRGEEAAARELEGRAAALVAEVAREEARAAAAARRQATAGKALQALRAGVAAGDAARRADPLPRVEAAHARAVAGLDEARAALGSDDAALSTALGDARRRADLALAHALVSRAPTASLERLRALAEGDPALASEGALLHARALARAGRVADARAALAPLEQAERAELRAGAAALDLALAEAPQAARVVAWRDATAATPRAAWAWLGLAEAHAGLGQLLEAQEAYDRAQRLDPTDPWIAVSWVDRTTPPCRDWVVTAGTLDLVPILTAELPASSKPVQLAHLWRGIVPWELPPTDLRALAREAGLEGAAPAVVALVGLRRARVMNRPDVAVAIARSLLQREPGQRDAVGFMAWGLSCLGRWDEVVQVVTEALPRAPEDPDLHCALGRALWRRGDPAAAARHLALAARPSLDAARWVELARCLLDARQPRGALEAARRAAALDPGVNEAHSEQVELPPHDPAISLTLGDALAAAGDPARASLHHLLAFVKSQLEEGLHPAGLLEAGADQEALGLREEARWIYTLAARIPPLQAEAEARLRALGE